MTILVTGGTGFLGSHVVEQLAHAGKNVRALVRRSSDTSFLKSLPHVELMDGAIDDASSLERAVSGVEAIIHCAGLVKARSETEFQNVNAKGTSDLVKAARAQKLRRFVLVSSLAAAGPSDKAGSPVVEGQEPGPVTGYGRSKLAAERAALLHRTELPLTILRPPAVYGPRDREILAFFKAVKAGVLPLFGSAKNKLSMTYAADCAAACIRATDVEVPSGSVFYVDDGAVHTLEEMIFEVERVLGRKAWLRIPLPIQVVRSAALASEVYGAVSNRAMMFTRDKCNELFEQWVCDGSPARKALGWEPKVTFAEGIRRTAAWYQQAGWL